VGVIWQNEKLKDQGLRLKLLRLEETLSLLKRRVLVLTFGAITARLLQGLIVAKAKKV
jgi:hypothetical protein